MNITDPGGEPTIALIETERMSSSTPAPRGSGRSEQHCGGQNGSPAQMTKTKLAASKAQLVAEEEGMEQSALVPTILLLLSSLCQPYQALGLQSTHCPRCRMRQVILSALHCCPLTRKDWEVAANEGIFCDLCQRLCRTYGEWCGHNCLMHALSRVYEN